MYGEHNLNQLDLRVSKRFSMDRYRLRLDFDLYNVFNSSWPFTVNIDLFDQRDDEPVAAADQRPAASLLQVRRTVLVLIGFALKREGHVGGPTASKGRLRGGPLRGMTERAGGWTLRPVFFAP